MIKQLFCKHIYKNTEREDLYKTSSLQAWGVIIVDITWQHYAQHKVCIKCGKKIVTEHKYVYKVK